MSEKELAAKLPLLVRSPTGEKLNDEELKEIADSVARAERPEWGNKEDNIDSKNVESMIWLIKQSVWEPDEDLFKLIGITLIAQIVKDFGLTRDEIELGLKKLSKED